MKFKMICKEYIDKSLDKCNEPLCLDNIFKPFGFDIIAEKSKYLLLGHFIDYINNIFKSSDNIDCMDLVDAAIDIGYEEARKFVDLLLEIRPL